MVAKTAMKRSAARAANKPTGSKKASVTKGGQKATTKTKGFRIRLGILTGKDFDPIPVGTHDRNYPKRFQAMNNSGPNASGWGGKYHIDVSTGLKIGRLYPDIFEIDLMTGKEITPARLKKNHLNLNFWYDAGVALVTGDKKHFTDVLKCHTDADCRMWPSGDYYDWILRKPRYMKQCMKAGIPMIDTIFIDNGFKAKTVLKQIQAKGWDKFFVKPAHFSFFGSGAIYGKTEDFVNDISKFEAYEKDNKHQKLFLVQPYTLKPNGNVFDEVRNFFIDGEWAYSVYTDGTDYEGVYEEPAGARKEACKALAQRVYKEVLKAAKWEGKPIKTLLNRIDIGVVPDKSKPKGFHVFLNEIELEMTTWLARYVPFNLCNRMAEASVKKSRELLQGMLKAGRKVPDREKIKELLKVLDERCGPVHG